MKLTFGDADTQLCNSPTTTSKRLRLAADSVDFLADVRAAKDKPEAATPPPPKFRLLFGGSSEELSQQQQQPGDGDQRDADAADGSDVTSGSSTTERSGTASESGSGEDEAELMTQADEAAMKSYLPLGAALSYISNDDDDDVLELFFLKRPGNRLSTANCAAAKPARQHPSMVDTPPAAAAAGLVTHDDARGSRTVKTCNTLSVAKRQRSSSGGREVGANAKSFVEEPDTVLSEFIGDGGRLLRASTAERVAGRSKVRNERTRSSSSCSRNEASCLASEVAFGRELTATTDDGIQKSDPQADQITACPAQSHSQGLCMCAAFLQVSRGVDPYGTGGTRPPQYLDRGDMITNVPPIFVE